VLPARLPDLPIHAVLDDVTAALDEPGAAVLVAPPGTGKTTVMPLAMPGRVVIAEPRRLAARAAAGTQTNSTATGGRRVFRGPTQPVTTPMRARDATTRYEVTAGSGRLTASAPDESDDDDVVRNKSLADRHSGWGF
jgi:hypothetical protein